MSGARNAAALELQQAIEDLQLRLARASKLAQSTGLVKPSWFGGAHGMVTMAAGDLHARGLWLEQPAEAQKATG